MNIVKRICRLLIWGFVLFQCRAVWSEQATIEWQQQQYRPLFYDFNQDNIPDLLLHAESEVYPSLLVLGQIDSVEVRYLAENSIQLPTKIADMDWSASQAQLLPLQNSAESRSLLVVFPNRKTAQLFAFNGQTIDFRHPIAKYQATDWAFLAQVADHELHVADFNNDGIDEILQLANVGGQHQILKLQPNFNLKSQQTFPENLPWGLSGQARIIIRDFDNNGYADIFALAKAPGSPHYLVLSDQTGQFKNPQGQEISATLGGKPWFDDGSGTVVAQLPEEQRNVLLRFYNNAEVTTSAGSKCVGWIFDPQQNTSWEYCLPVKSAVQPAGAKPQVTGKLQPQAVQSQPVLPFIQSSCPIIDPASTIDVFDPSASGWCPPSGIATPGSAPTLAASSYPVNFRFSAKMQTIYAASKVYYELWALDEAGVFSMLGMVVIASPESNKPIVSVLAGFANAGNYQLMYRICEDYGCGGFSPSTTVRIYKDTVKHTVSTNVSFGGSIYPVTSSVEQGRSFSFTLTVNSGYNIGSVSGCNGSLSGNIYTTGAISGACTVSATFNLAPVYHTVSTSSGSGGSISPASRSVLQGTSTSFTVHPSLGYLIASVSGCGGSLSGNTFTTGAVNGACTVSASFNLAPVYYSVSASAGTGGSISPASRSVVKGSSTSFTVAANSGYSIASVSGCGGSLSGNTFTTGAVNGACTVSASFNMQPVNYTVSTSAGSGGSISPASRSVVKGSSTSFTVAANSGYSIASVSGCGGSLSGNTFTTGAVNGACTVSASFNAVPVLHTISTSAGPGGNVSPTSRSVGQGSRTSFDVIPMIGFSIGSVSGCGGSLSGNTFTTGAINGACTVSASFNAVPVLHTISTSTGTGGSISPVSRSVNHGSETTFTIIANSGFVIDQVTGCNGSLYGSLFTTGAVNSSCTLSATFKAGVATPQLIYLHTDALGSVIAETDANGVVIKKTEYKPFGQSVDN